MRCFHYSFEIPVSGVPVLYFRLLFREKVIVRQAMAHPPDDASPQPLCPFLSLLSEADRFQYACLRATISSWVVTLRGLSCPLSCSKILVAIKSFVVRNDRGDPLRGFVCGIFWRRGEIAVSTRQLRFLVPKCKAAINGCLQRLGFCVHVRPLEAGALLLAMFPFARGCQGELRKWGVRRVAPAAVGGPPASVLETPPVLFPLPGVQAPPALPVERPPGSVAAKPPQFEISLATLARTLE
jgi:hypothetical protein